MTSEEHKKIAKALAENSYGIAIPDTGLQNSHLIDHHLIRDDMTAKGQGLLGNINGNPGQDSPAMSEYSIGIQVPKNYEHIPGMNPRVAPLLLDSMQKYYDAPSVVPGLSPKELSELAKEKISNAIYDAAERNASDRQWEGKPVFAGSSEIVRPYPKRK